MLALVMAVLAASALGSFHCAGMCGAFVAIAVSTAGEHESRSRLNSRAGLNAFYNFGRLITYCILGALAGLLGGAIDIGGVAVGIQRAAMSAAGALLVVFGISLLLRLAGVALPKPAAPAFIKKPLFALHRAAFTLPPAARALAIGMLTTLLPCGWLYAFAITAAGTANPAHAALVMAVFWLGTLPVMAFLGAGVATLAGPLKKRLPVLTALALVAVGLYAILGRLAIPPVLKSATGEVVSVADQINRLDRIDPHAVCNPR
jgi:uncharacterized protein